MEEYFGLVVALLAGFVGVVGGTYDKDREGINKITTTGWCSIILIILGCAISAVKYYNSEIESEELRTESEELQDRVQSTNAIVKKLNIDLASQKSIIETYKDLIERLDLRSERQPQIVFTKAIDLRPSESHLSENVVFGGSVIKPRGFDCELLFEYSDRKIVIPKARLGEAVEFVVRGVAGRGMKWRLTNKSRAFCTGKFQIESSPRIRSESDSEFEERIGTCIQSTLIKDLGWIDGHKTKFCKSKRFDGHFNPFKNYSDGGYCFKGDSESCKELISQSVNR